MIRRISLLTASITALILLVFPILNPQSVSALSGSQFSAGRIIDDYLFFNGSTMSVSQIQSFLNAKVPDCDSNGDIMYNSTQTRKQYAASQGVSTPFICLRSYNQNTPSRPSESGLCSALTAKTGRSSANIINDVADACGVSQKVLLVLLQKEQSLVTDDWPWPIQYRSATGFGCPDTAPCDEEYYGFFNQVYNAARQFKRYAADPTHYNHRFGFNNSVRFHPNASCGSSTVFIENQATAGLYNYTPYQPNQAALNNLYGTGNSCSAYGNRNFWRMYNDWFGPTSFAFNPNVAVTQGIEFNDSTPGEGQSVTVTVKIHNYGSVEAAIGLFAVAVRDPANNIRDFSPDHNVIIEPGETYTYSKTRSFSQSGSYETWTTNYRPGHGWQTYYPINASGGLARETTFNVHRAQVAVNSGLSFSDWSPTEGQDVTATFKAKNYDNFPVNIGKMAVAVRGPNGSNFDFSPDSDIIIQPGATYTYSKTRSFSIKGSYRAWTTNFRPGQGWETYYPGNASGGLIREKTFNVGAAPVGVNAGLSLSDSTPSSGQNVTVTFSVKNYASYQVNIGKMAVAVRGPNGSNFDFSPDSDIIIQPGATYTYSKTRSFSIKGSYRAWTTNFRPGQGWETYYPSNVSGSIVRELNFTVN